MSLLGYLYSLRASFRKFFNSKDAAAINDEKTKYEVEVCTQNKDSLNHKCKKAAQEIQYISSFTHWPIAKAKTKTQKDSLVYLDVNRNKRASLEQRNKRARKVVQDTNKLPLANKISTVKKFPNQ